MLPAMSAATPPSPNVDAAPAAPLALRGLVLAAGAGASLLLSLQHLASLALPGCGSGSACARAAASLFGSIPGLGWPLAHVGSAWFAGLGAAALAARRLPSGWPLGLARLGALASCLFLGIAWAGDYLCPYCLIVHAASLGYWALEEHARARRARAATPAPLRPGAALFAFLIAASFVTLALFVQELRVGRRVDDVAEHELQESTTRLLAGEATTAFRGRWLIGPERARVRIVIFSDYQCPDCRTLEGDLQGVLARYPDEVSFSAKHFPYGTSCNPRARERREDLHPNACLAARAAEAAGEVGGPEGFLRMHRWLFEREGRFSESSLISTLAELDLPREAFLAAYRSAELGERVAADIDEALKLGIAQTPLVYLNGVELRGWNAPSALPRAVEALLESGARPATAASDAPLDAVGRMREVWEQTPVSLADQARDAVVVWGDLSDPRTRELFAYLAELETRPRPPHIELRHFPFDESCNPHVPRTAHPRACFGAAALEAAAFLAGPQAATRLRRELVSLEPEEWTETRMAQLAQAAGLDGSALLAALESPQVEAGVRADLEQARSLGLRSIPFLFVAGRHVRLWRSGGVEGLAGLLRD